MARLTTRRLNELLMEVVQRRMDAGALWLPTFPEPVDPAPDKPWLPESFWVLKQRQSEDQWLAEHASVADVLEEGIPSLLGRDERLDRVNWGRLPMKHSGGEVKPPTQGDQQPAYNWECFQCGRPITGQGLDHAGQRRCDAALMPADYEPFRHHQFKPWHGEEEDDEDDE